MTCQNDFTFLIPMAYRDQVETQPLIGFMVNAVPVRGQLDDAVPLEDDARNWGEKVLQSSANNIPHGFLVRGIEGLRPHIQVMFQYLDASEVVVGEPFGKLTSKPYASKKTALSHSKVELFFHVSSKKYTLEYYDELFDIETIEKLADSLDTILSGVASLLNN